MNNKIRMITGAPEARVLAKLAAPMMIGILGMSIFNIMDTFYVARLGTAELAALSFTFPVIMIISSVAHGLGVGMTAAVSKAAGSGNNEKLVNVISWGLLLAAALVVIVVIGGELTVKIVFTALGADDQTLPLITDYMQIWYIGAAFVVIPMIGNSAIRGLGDTKLPSTVMLTAAAINTVLDPLLIFGIGPFPEMGVKGAALSTVFARFITFNVALWILIKREKVISFKNPSSAVSAWKELLFVGIPNTLIKLIIPLGTAVITRIISSHGQEAVAGFGVASKIEMFSLMPLMALTAVTPIFVGQNISAGKGFRVLKGLSLSARFAVIYGVFISLLLFFFGRNIAGFFNKSPDVVSVVFLYMIIVAPAFCFRGMMDLSVTSLSVIEKPVHSAVISLIQMFVLYIPMAYLGSRVLGVKGIFGALSVSLVITGLSSFFGVRKYIKKIIR